MSYRKPTKIERVCKGCNKPFLAIRGEVNRGGGIFCSRGCGKYDIVECRTCKKIFRSPKCRSSIYCNKDCYRHCSLEERFWEAVSKSEGCWSWSKGKIMGYGCLKNKGKMVKAHRYSYELHKGAIPEGMCVCHKCDNRECNNPEHLFLGTQLDNVEDMLSKGRNTKGVDCHFAKLKECEVVEIRRRFSEGNTITELMALYSMSRSAIEQVVKRLKWKHIV